jgi:hypothetical protein
VNLEIKLCQHYLSMLEIGIHHRPYLAVSRLTMEGKCVSIEGDVDGAIQSLVGSYLGIGPGFLTDWLEHDRSSISLWHPGMASLGHLPRHWQRTWTYLGRSF